ncbi:transcription repressor NadR [Listeria aquatica]|uniref:Transcription repressor NadR n=1 Tax=Listeria aquatica FSL S10-1188 TaxID=1265818 RepID=W7BIW3_9LIST|nr:transcription repressor NadR [Listeria aquatica]EUJ19693.1 Transcription repressor NadR [Listeria aquatica FSL S10-1188]
MKKMLGEDRREAILDWLKHTSEPISGGELAKRTDVSRQVIVQDISLLRAMEQPIISTPQGYMMAKESKRIQRIIACNHTKEEAETELNMLVDYGVSVIDVIVDHPIYGELTGNLHLNSRFDVEKFIYKLKNTDALMLSGLTNGLHLHTVEADTEEQIDKAIEILAEMGILVR